jgi:hypothetical protein
MKVIQPEKSSKNVIFIVVQFDKYFTFAASFFSKP